MKRGWLLPAVMLFTALPWSAEAQVFQKEVYTIPIIRSGISIDHAFAGGFTNPGHQFADLDGDGDLDLVVLDMSDDALLYFRNEGNRQSPLFRQDATPDVFPHVRNWIRIADVNGDGLPDLLSAGEAPNSIALYHNTGTANVPAFTLTTPSLHTNTDTLVLALLFSIPALTDIDNDGDTDLFSLNAGIGTINYYENIGGATDFLLVFRTDFFQNIRICPGCGGVPDHQVPAIHGNGAVEFADVDGNGTKDMFYGDLFDIGLFFYKNTGTPESAKLDSITGEFPPSNPVQTVGYNQPTLADINGDGAPDLFVSVLHSSVQTDNFWFYNNTGTPTQYEYLLATKNYLPTFDVGAQSAPALADIDTDGDLDMCVGDLLGRVSLLRNNGNQNVGEFYLEDSNYVGVMNRFAYVPRFGDLDGDGDQDLVLGHFAGNVDFFRNTGTPTLPQFSYEQSFFDSLKVGLFASPDLFDIDGDGDLDLFVGSAGGTVRFYRNRGSISVWNFVLDTNALGGVNIGPNAKPVLGDVDADGDGDLILGSSEGALSLFRNSGTRSNPVFTEAGEPLVSGGGRRETVPVLGDIDGDGDLDLLVGNSRGGLEFFRNTQSTSVTTSQSSGRLQGIVVSQYPNPFNPTATITVDLPYDGEVSLDIFDTTGRKVTGLIDGWHGAGRHTVKFEATTLAGGVYVYRIITRHETYMGKMVFLR